MTRLTDSEEKDFRKRLSEWQNPESMCALVEKIRHKLGAKDFFNQRALSFLRDAWIAGRFSKLRGADEVRLVNEDCPDFELKISGGIERFEATEADSPDRRRGEYYRKGIGQVEDCPFEGCLKQAEQAESWVRKAAEKKAKKQYGVDVNLVIYLNLQSFHFDSIEYDICQEKIESCFGAATKSAKSKFKAVWVLWDDKAYKV